MTNTSIAERATIALLFAGSAALTIAWYGSMSAMAMPMPGGWAMSMTWMRSPGQTWLGAAAAFTGMWTLMMIAMMLPALMPMLSRYRRLATMRSAAVATLVYFAVWGAFGVVVFAFGTMLASVEMRQPAVARAVPSSRALSSLRRASGNSRNRKRAR